MTFFNYHDVSYCFQQIYHFINDQYNVLLLNHRLFISRLETESFGMFFFTVHFSRICRFVQSAWIFLLGSLAQRICPIKLVEYAWPQKNFAPRANIFSSILFFVSASVSSLLNKESMVKVWENIKRVVKNGLNIIRNIHELSFFFRLPFFKSYIDNPPLCTEILFVFPQLWDSSSLKYMLSQHYLLFTKLLLHQKYTSF